MMQQDNRIIQQYNIISVSTMEIEDKIVATILCPMCGIQFIPTLGNICQACAIAKTDITIGITKEALINYCRFCHRFMTPAWVFCERDSKGLLEILLKKIKGLNKAKIINALFIWTEPHSKRIKLKVTIEKELNNKTKIEQSFISEFIEVYTQCDDCKKQFTPHTWGAVVQMRQHVEHKKTFFLIEQLILKHNAFDKVLKVSVEDDGINFYYKNTTHAQRILDFLSSILPTIVKNSKQLISHDMNSNTFVYKYAFAVELPKICKNDLVILPKSLSKELGCSQMLLCQKVALNIGLIDLNNFNYILMSSTQYYHYEKDIQLLSLHKYKRQFQILNTEPVDKKQYHKVKSTLNKYASKIFYYNITRKDQWENIEVKGSLGDLHCGSIVEGFDLRYLNHTEDLGDIKGYQDIVLVRKIKDKNTARVFKLKKLEDEGVMIEEKEGKKKKKNKEGQDEEDYEDFMNDVEADPELRKHVKMYKDKDVTKHMSKEELENHIQDMELVDLLEDLNINEQPEGAPVTEDQSKQIEELIAKMEKVVIQKD